MPTTPQVSVLIPAYNAERHAGPAIESILGQTFRDIEVVIADDQSSDGTWQLLERYADADPRVRLIRNEKNSGVSKTRNRLIKSARGAYIAWQDADDISDPKRIEKQHAFLEQHPDVAIVGAFLEITDGNGMPISVRRYAADDASLRKRMFKYSPVSQPVAMIRADVLRQSGLFDESLKQAEDLDLSFRIGRFGKFANIQEVLLHYRYHPQSLSAGKLRDNILSTLAVRKRAHAEYGFRMGASDRLAYAATWGVQYLPPALTQKLFTIIRNALAKL